MVIKLMKFVTLEHQGDNSVSEEIDVEDFEVVEGGDEPVDYLVEERMDWKGAITTSSKVVNEGVDEWSMQMRKGMSR